MIGTIILHGQNLTVRADINNTVHIDPHTEANVDARIRKGEMKDVKKSAEQLRAEGFRKIGVNEIGDVLDHGPRTLE